MTHDIFMTWLTSPHYGLGRSFTEYKVPGWAVLSSPDPHHRCAGVAMYISERVASHSKIRFQEVVPGRLLHARIPLGRNKQQTHLDLINAYQWAWDSDVTKQRQDKRLGVWQRLSRLLTNLPRRNLAQDSRAVSYIRASAEVRFERPFVRTRHRHKL